MTARRSSILAALGFLLIAVSVFFALFFVFGYVLIGNGFFLGWQDMLWIAGGTHVVGWGLMWLGLDERNLGLQSSRAVLGGACALMIAAAAFVLLGLGQYGQWREYRNAPRCAATERALERASARCTSEQAAVVEEIRVDTSTPSQYNAPTPGQTLEIKLADGRRQTVSVPQPPLVPPGPSCAGLFSDVLAHRGIYNCEVPVKARLYRGRVRQLTLPGGQKADTDEQPGRYRLVAWLGALCLLGALWPLLPIGLILRRAGRAEESGPMGGSPHAPAQPLPGGGLPPRQRPPGAPRQGLAGPSGRGPTKPWWQRPRAIILSGFVVLVVIVAIGAASRDMPKDCDGITASSTCTPRVGSDEQIRLDGLTWRVTGAETTRRIGDRWFGEKADGTFLIVKLKVWSNGYESATLTSNVIELKAGGVTYERDNDGSFAAPGAGGDAFWLIRKVGPGPTKIEAVFDLPDSVLRKTLFVRFNELSFGPGHGYIEVPEPASR